MPLLSWSFFYIYSFSCFAIVASFVFFHMIQIKEVYLVGRNYTWAIRFLKKKKTNMFATFKYFIGKIIQTCINMWGFHYSNPKWKPHFDLIWTSAFFFLWFFSINVFFLFYPLILYLFFIVLFNSHYMDRMIGGLTIWLSFFFFFSISELGFNPDCFVVRNCFF